MSLFRINGKPLLFELMNLDEAERAAFTAMIESEGGEVTSDESVTVKFTSRDAYDKNDPPVRTKIYDVQFIEECIRERKILMPELYRLDERIGEDDYHVHHLMYGKCIGSRQEYSFDGEVQLVTHPVQIRCEVGQQESGEVQMVYSAKTPPGDSAMFDEHDVSVDRESIDDSQSDQSASLELETSASSLADDDPVESHEESSGERLVPQIEEPKAEKALRRLPIVRDPLRADAGDSSDSAAEATIPSAERTRENSDASTLSEPEITPDGWPAGRDGDANDAGPSRVRIGDKNLVRNIAHRSFLTHSIRVDDKKPRVEHNTAKKTSRGQEWRAKLKSQTDGWYRAVKTRIRYTPSERKIMLRYLVKNRCIGRAKGLVVWKQMITDGHLTGRTPQSLQNQFRKYVLPNIEQVKFLEASDVRKFVALRSGRR